MRSSTWVLRKFCLPVWLWIPIISRKYSVVRAQHKFYQHNVPHSKHSLHRCTACALRLPWKQVEATRICAQDPSKATLSCSATIASPHADTGYRTRAAAVETCALQTCECLRYVQWSIYSWENYQEFSSDVIPFLTWLYSIFPTNQTRSGHTWSSCLGYQWWFSWSHESRSNC